MRQFIVMTSIGPVDVSALKLFVDGPVLWLYDDSGDPVASFMDWLYFTVAPLVGETK